MVIHLAVKLFVPGIDKNGEITMAYIKNKKGNSIWNKRTIIPMHMS